MEDGGSRLLCCKTLGGADTDDAFATTTSSSGGGAPASESAIAKQAAAAAPCCWISTVCEASELVMQGGVDVLTDWQVTAQPPLTVRNDLPVAAHYMLWERAARGGSLVLRQQGRLEGWSSVNVYSVDLRQQVSVLHT
jgi:hypothetical protein